MQSAAGARSTLRVQRVAAGELVGAGFRCASWCGSSFGRDSVELFDRDDDDHHAAGLANSAETRRPARVGREAPECHRWRHSPRSRPRVGLGGPSARTGGVDVRHPDRLVWIEVGSPRRSGRQSNHVVAERRRNPPAWLWPSKSTVAGLPRCCTMCWRKDLRPTGGICSSLPALDHQQRNRARLVVDVLRIVGLEHCLPLPGIVKGIDLGHRRDIDVAGLSGHTSHQPLSSSGISLMSAGVSTSSSGAASP